MSGLNTAVLPSCYFPPVQWLSKLLLYSEIAIDPYEYFIKQTYRNRCMILGANKPINLTVPVKKVDGNKTRMKDVRIDYDTRWQHNHIRSIESAYQSAPFFEYTWDEIRIVLTKKEKFLVDLNEKLVACILEYVDIDVNYRYSKQYVEPEKHLADYRNMISPKKNLAEDPSFIPEPYMQVFNDRKKFVPNLSILDLLFNEGPQARMVLLKSIRKRPSKKYIPLSF